MIEIREVTADSEKLDIVRNILGGFPMCSEDIAAFDEHLASVWEIPFWGVFDKNEPIGFIAIKIYDGAHGELLSIGVDEGYRRISIGRGLFNIMQNYALAKGLGYLTVKQSEPSSPYYKENIGFLKAMGFLPYGDAGEETNGSLLSKDLKDADNSYKCKSSEELNEQR